VSARPPDEDGYRLWLRYEPIADPAHRAAVRAAFGRPAVLGSSATVAAARDELGRGLSGLLGEPVEVAEAASGATLVAAAGEAGLGPEGFAIRRSSGAARVFTLAAGSDVGVLYGVFHLLRQLQMGLPDEAIAGESRPRAALRMLDHWDNLDGTIERGYAGASLWD
jgi:alpha-glucuronidase